jgi:hypothetical protein
LNQVGGCLQSVYSFSYSGQVDVVYSGIF